MKKGLLHAILASTLWAIVNSLIKQGLSNDVTPMNFSETRFATVGVILFAYTRYIYDRNHLNLYYYSKHCMDCKVSISLGLQLLFPLSEHIAGCDE